MDRSMLSLIGAAALMDEVVSKPTRKRKMPRTGIVMPKKDYARRQARNKMAKQSRKKNRA
jgi:hypothetical protein